MPATPFHAYYMARRLESLQNDDKLIPAFASSDINVYPYQIGAALFATRSPYTKGVVLMDESGLGKSTEAMLVACQKWYEGRTRIIIIVPNSDLLVQWQRMMDEKYSVPYAVIASNEELAAAGNTFDCGQIVLTTYDYAVMRAADIERIRWDLAVFEEASLLSSVYKDDNKEARTLKRITEGSFKLLLTGTPIEKNILDLYGLMYFIDETVLPSEQEYMSRYFRKPERYPELAGLVSKYCFRTLRSQAKRYVKLPDRIVMTCEFEQSTEEQRLYDLLQAYIEKPEKYAFPEMGQYDLALMLFDHAASSTAAITKAIRGIIDRLRKLPEAADELTKFEEMLDAAAEIKEDTKYTILAGELENIFKVLKRSGAKRKAVIFTGSRETQGYLYNKLKEGYNTYIYNGSKDYRVIEGFKADGEILITTDRGARALNLEDASFVVNYDLLYNTMKMEQRIDRCHRLNQQNDVIVLNLLNKSNMADVRKLELVNKRMLVADGVFGQTDAILGGFTDNIRKSIRTIKLRTKAQIESDYENTLRTYEKENRRAVESAESILFTTFTTELAKSIKITPQYAEERVRRVNDELWELVKCFFEEYNSDSRDCHFLINEEKRTVSATGYIELPYLFYYWNNGRSVRYKALKEFKKITLLSPLARGILSNTECADRGVITVAADVENCEIGFYTVKIYAGRRETGQIYNLLYGRTESGKQFSDKECSRILDLPVLEYSESGKRTVAWLKNGTSYCELDNLVPTEELIQKSIADNSSVQTEEIDRIKRVAANAKSALEHTADDLQSELNSLIKQTEDMTSNRLERLKLERRIGETKNKLLKARESIYFDAMRIDMDCEEKIKQFLNSEKINAKVQRHFVVEIKHNMEDKNDE